MVVKNQLKRQNKKAERNKKKIFKTWQKEKKKVIEK
jgi:hypothetical protein